MQPCPDKIADPLTTGDQYDMARALVQATTYGKDCKAKHEALIDSVHARENILNQLKKQMDGK